MDSGPGARDLTAHVDFEACAMPRAARRAAVRPVGQGAWLRAMGIDLRAASLAKAAPERTEEIVLARERLTAPSRWAACSGAGAGRPRLAGTGGLLT
jgi:SAM-dependent MidA family methyltransferase